MNSYRAEWWVAIGGIAQVAAALFAIYAIAQNKAMLRLADQERHEAIAPDWDTSRQPGHGPRLDPADPQGDGTATIHLALENTGWGPARHPAWEFTNEMVAPLVGHPIRPVPTCGRPQGVPSS